jgi:hypothetical protein
LAVEGYPQIGNQLCGERLYLDLCGATSDDDDRTGRCGSLMYSMGIGLSKGLLFVLFGRQHQSGR